MNQRLVVVEWIDSHVDQEWRTLEDIRDTADYEDSLRNFTAGYLLLDEAGYLLVASTRTPSSERDPVLYGNTTQIPRVAVVAVRDLVLT